MAKKKAEASEGGATKKQATETKKAATAAKAPARESAPKATKSAASAPPAAKPAAAEKQSAGGAATRKKAGAKGSGGSSHPAGAPLIDTSLAAATAAAFVANRAMLGSSGAPSGAAQPEAAEDAPQEDKRESSTFKQLKAGLNKPAGQGIGGILGTSNVGKKGNSPFGGGNQQVGRNQTFGGDITRSGVPRRTGG